MNIIFLDIDGVLNSKRFELNQKFQTTYIPYYSDIDITNVQYLNQLINILDAKIIIHSDWRTEFTLTQFQDFFSHFGLSSNSIIGTVDSTTTKVIAIEKYLNENNINKFIILEDERLFELNHPLYNKLYKVSPNGLIKDDLNVIIKLFNN